MATAARAGSPQRDAAQALYERFYTSVYRYALTQVRSPQDAEDATQDTFLRAFAALAEGRSCRERGRVALQDRPQRLPVVEARVAASPSRRDAARSRRTGGSAAGGRAPPGRAVRARRRARCNAAAAARGLPAARMAGPVVRRDRAASRHLALSGRVAHLPGAPDARGAARVAAPARTAGPGPRASCSRRSEASPGRRVARRQGRGRGRSRHRRHDGRGHSRTTGTHPPRQSVRRSQPGPRTRRRRPPPPPSGPSLFACEASAPDAVHRRNQTAAMPAAPASGTAQRPCRTAISAAPGDLGNDGTAGPSPGPSLPFTHPAGARRRLSVN